LRRDGCWGDRLKERPLPKEGGIKEAVAETYMAEILQTHRKVFIILAVISATFRIFDAVDKGAYDKAQPISKTDHLVIDLSLSQIEASRFLKEQYRWMVKLLDTHEHIDYTDKDVIPFQWIKEF
jgi:hypothetical protein